MEFLKNIFGEKALTFDDFKAALEADKGVKLVNLKDDIKKTGIICQKSVNITAYKSLT